MTSSVEISASTLTTLTTALNSVSATTLALLLSLNLMRVENVVSLINATSVVGAASTLVGDVAADAVDPDVVAWTTTNLTDGGKSSGVVMGRGHYIAGDMDDLVPRLLASTEHNQPQQRGPHPGVRAHRNVDASTVRGSSAVASAATNYSTAATVTITPRSRGRVRSPSLSLLSLKRRKSNLRKSFQRPVNARRRKQKQFRGGDDQLVTTDAANSWTTSSRLVGGGNRHRRPYQSVDDSLGAGYYVTAVLVVYSLSAVLLLASRISRKHTRLIEDRQTRKYLQEFQVSFQSIQDSPDAAIAETRFQYTKDSWLRFDDLNADLASFHDVIQSQIFRC